MAAPVQLTNEKLSELKEAFMLFDYDKDGRIQSRDVGAVIRSVGLRPSQDEIKEIIQDVENGGGQIDLQTLVTVISRKVTSPPRERPDDLREMFRMYDTKGNGTISKANMVHLLTTVGEKLTDQEAEDLLRISGCEKNGSIDYDRFVKVILQGQ